MASCGVPHGSEEAAIHPRDGGGSKAGERHLPEHIKETLTRLRVDEHGRFTRADANDENTPSTSENPEPVDLPRRERFRRVYDPSFSTEDTYSTHRTSKEDFASTFRRAREQLDYSYHCNYSLDRQELVQDPIIAVLTARGASSSQPWVAFTAGVMGSGKSHTLATLDSLGLFNLRCFVRIDPDEVRLMLPEFQVLIERDQSSTGAKTQKEVGLICEIATLVAMAEGQHVLLDGSLRNAQWYKHYFSYLRRSNPRCKLAILHIVASKATIMERARKRGERTGRVIPYEDLQQSIREVPKSVDELSPLVDYVATIQNDGGELRLLSGASSFLEFSGIWGLCERLGQPCPGAERDVLRDPGYRRHERGRVPYRA